MRIVQISDLHFGALEHGRPESMRTAILAARPDLIVVSGDLSQRGTIAELTEAKAFLDSISIPQLVVPGNHDMPRYWRVWDRFWRPWHSYRRIVSEDLEPVWKSDGAFVIGTNSARTAGWYVDWSRGRVSRSQLERMEKLCEDSPPGALRILVVHHPPAAPPSGSRRHLLGRRELFLESVNKAGIDVVLAGHFHVSYAVPLPLSLSGGQGRSCVLSVTSTATSHRLKGEPNGFHVIEGDAAALSVTRWSFGDASYGSGNSWRFEAYGTNRDWQALE